MINEYKEKYLRGEIPQNSYDDCRYAKDKVQYAKDWLTKIKGRDIDFDHPRNIVDEICAEQEIYHCRHCYRVRNQDNQEQPPFLQVHDRRFLGLA